MQAGMGATTLVGGPYASDQRNSIDGDGCSTADGVEIARSVGDSRTKENNAIWINAVLRSILESLHDTLDRPKFRAGL